MVHRTRAKNLIIPPLPPRMGVVNLNAAICWFVFYLRRKHERFLWCESKTQIFGSSRIICVAKMFDTQYPKSSRIRRTAVLKKSLASFCTGNTTLLYYLDVVLQGTGSGLQLGWVSKQYECYLLQKTVPEWKTFWNYRVPKVTVNYRLCKRWKPPSLCSSCAKSQRTTEKTFVLCDLNSF